MVSTAPTVSVSTLPSSAARADGVRRDALFRLFRLAFIVLCAALVAAIGYKKPTHDWDMIAYVASALHDEGMRGQAWLDEVYSQVRAETNDDEYAQLVGKDSTAANEQIAAYRAGVARDWRALEQQLPFYRVKFVYMALVKGVHRLGLPYAKATYAVSAVSAGAMTLLFGLLLMRLRLPLLLLPVGIAAANICAFHNTVFQSLASLPSPDGFACLCALLCLWLAASNDEAGFVAAALAPLARPDFVILSATLVGAILVSRLSENSPPRLARLRRPLMLGVLSLACAGAIYVAQNHFLGSYSFATLFNFTFMGFAPYPESMAISHNPRDYLLAYTHIGKLFESRHIVIYGLVFVALANTDLRALTRDRFTLVFVFAALAYVAIHLAVFPSYSDRFFAFAVVGLFLWLARLLTHIGGRELTPVLRDAAGMA